MLVCRVTVMIFCCLCACLNCGFIYDADMFLVGSALVERLDVDSKRRFVVCRCLQYSMSLTNDFSDNS